MPAHGSFCPLFPIYPLRMKSSVHTILTSICTAMAYKHVYPSTYSWLPPYGTASFPDFVSRKLKLNIYNVRNSAPYHSFQTLSADKTSASITSCHIGSLLWPLCLHLNHIFMVYPKSCYNLPPFVHLFLTVQLIQYLHLCSGTHTDELKREMEINLFKFRQASLLILSHTESEANKSL